MKYLVPLCLFAIVAGLFFGLGGIGKTQPNLAIVYAWDAENGTWTSELDYWDDWSINPCKITYGYWENSARVGMTISNLSGEDCSFALGDGSIVVIIPAKTSLSYSYEVNLTGQTERIRITKLADKQSDISVQEALVLKIEPRTKGGDTR